MRVSASIAPTPPPTVVLTRINCTFVMAMMFGSTSPPFYCTRTSAKKPDIKTLNDDKKMTPSETPTSAWLKTNGTKPKSRVKAQSLSPQVPSLNTTTTDVIAQTGVLSVANCYIKYLIMILSPDR